MTGGTARGSRKSKPPGMSPGSPVLTGEALPSRIHSIRYTASSIEESDPRDAAECVALIVPGAITWLDVQGLADVELLKSLGERLKLHPLALEDVVSLSQRPKAEDYDTHLFVIVRMPETNETLSTDQTSLFIGQGFLLTFQEHYGDCLGPVRDRLRKGKGLMRRSGADYLAYTILDAIIDGFFPVLEAFGETLESLEGEVVESPTRGSLEKIHDVKRDLLTLRRAIFPLRDAINSLMRCESDMVSEQTRTYLRDCYDHCVQILDMVETYRELAASLMDIYISSLSQKLNEVMKVLTIISTIFIPLTFIVGVYGMNFDHMPELRWRLGYPIVMGGMAVLSLAMVWYFVRKGWIGPGEIPVSRPRARRRRGRRGASGRVNGGAA